MVGKKTCKIEIQLRTLLQDVWAELEHALVYKKSSVHPHIKKSFSLLARDLETNDLLLTHLKDISEKEQMIDSIALEHNGPYRVFWYEKDLIPELFRKSKKTKRLFKRYKKLAHSDNNKGCHNFVARMEKLYEEIYSKLLLKHMEDEKVDYWLKMEKAFQFFCRGEYGEAVKIYEEIIENETNQYVPFFRLGEIHFIRGDIEKALVAFDESEELLLKSKKGDRKLSDSYRLKVKLANIYWLMGREYCDIALNEIKEAERVFNKKPGLFSVEDNLSLKNNLCWYSLEKYIAMSEQKKCEATEEAYREAKNRFRCLKKRLNRPDVSSNSFDTAAWFCYYSYLKTGEQKWLDEAKEYCNVSLERKPSTTLAITSVNLQRSHIQTIMAA